MVLRIIATHKVTDESCVEILPVASKSAMGFFFTASMCFIIIFMNHSHFEAANPMPMNKSDVAADTGTNRRKV